MTDQSDKELLREKYRQYYQDHYSKKAKKEQLKKLKKKLYAKKYYHDNKETFKKRNRLWEKNNPDKVRLQNQRAKEKRLREEIGNYVKYPFSQPVRKFVI